LNAANESTNILESSSLMCASVIVWNLRENTT
jgi:hypothetical protein